MTRSMHRLGYSIAGAIAVAVGGSLFANAFDEPLSADAKLLAADSRQATPEPRNAYVWMLGLDAPPGEDAYASGARVVARLRQVEARGEDLARDDPLFADRLAVNGEQPMPCRPERVSCLDTVMVDTDAARRNLSAAGIFFERVSAMRAQPDFTDVYTPKSLFSPLPQYQNAARAQSATFLKAAIAVVDGRIEQAVLLAEEDMRFSRRMLSGSTTLIGKLIANVCVARNALFLSDLLSRRPEQMAPYRRRIASALRPLSQQEVSLEPALQNEAAMRLRTILGEGPPRGLIWADRDPEAPVPPAIANRMAALFYRPNATANEATRRFHEDLALAQVHTLDFDKARRASRASIEDYQDLQIREYFVNPTGNMLVRAARNDHANYIARMHDLEGLIALVRAQTAMPSWISPADRVAFLRSKEGESFADPYTGLPVSVDQATGDLFFVPRSDGSWVGEVVNRWAGTIRVGTGLATPNKP